MTKGQRIFGAVALITVIAGGGTVIVKMRSAKNASSATISAAAADRVVPVNVATVVRKDVPVIVEGLGTVTPLATVVVRSQVDGRLDKVVFKEGDAVKKGDVLALIDPRPFAIQLQQGSAALARDTANYKNAQVNLDRYTALRKDNLVAQQQVDDQRAMVEQLAAASKSDEATMATAKLNLDFARITSPIDGVTGVRLVDPGNIVHPQDANGIVIVTQLDPIGVLFTLPQDALPKVQDALKRGKPVVDIYARDNAKKLAQGELQLIDNQVNAQTATIRLKATTPNPDRGLWPNQFVKARLHLETISQALVVPSASIQRNGADTFVYVVAPNKTASPRDVAVASIEGDDAIVTKGLAAGDEVVVDGQNQLKPGAKVDPRTNRPNGGGARGSGPRASADKPGEP